MLRTDFKKKCIIMQFLVAEKTGKALDAEFVETLRKTETKNHEAKAAKQRQVPRRSG
jgi:hypothetical protein